jgi:hypothetical protein
MFDAFGSTYNAESMSDKQLRSAITRQEKASQRWQDKNGIIGRNVAQEKLVAYKWELARR